MNLTVTGALPDATSTEKEAVGSTGIAAGAIRVASGVTVAGPAVVAPGSAVPTVVASGLVVGDDSCPPQAVNRTAKTEAIIKTTLKLFKAPPPDIGTSNQSVEPYLFEGPLREAVHRL